MAHAQYLTYEQYKAYGGAMTDAAFLPAEFKCRKRIDYLTDSRVQDMTDIPEAVKMCMYSLINIESTAGAEAQISKPVITSFSADGYSESYGKALSAGDALTSMNALINTYLFGEQDDNGVPLLYRGVT